MESITDLDQYGVNWIKEAPTAVKSDEIYSIDKGMKKLAPDADEEMSRQSERDFVEQYPGDRVPKVPRLDPVAPPKKGFVFPQGIQNPAPQVEKSSTVLVGSAQIGTQNHGNALKFLECSYFNSSQHVCSGVTL